jgi:hypothetical protein
MIPRVTTAKIVRRPSGRSLATGRMAFNRMVDSMATPIKESASLDLTGFVLEGLPNRKLLRRVTDFRLWWPCGLNPLNVSGRGLREPPRDLGRGGTSAPPARWCARSWPPCHSET